MGRGFLPGLRSCYEEGKRFGEALCKAYGDQYGFDVKIARIFNSYGPRLRLRSLWKSGFTFHTPVSGRPGFDGLW